jgi:hypothetical protein
MGETRHSFTGLPRTRVSSYGGITADNDYTTCSSSGAPVGH